MTPGVSIVLVSTNAMEHMPLCLSSLSAQDYANKEVIVIDNNSQDGTPEYIESEFPQTRLLRQSANLGYRGGNSLGMQVANKENAYIVISNEDVEYDPHWLSSMVEAMEQNQDWGLATPKILLFYERGVINSVGNTFHFTGMYGPRGLGDRADARAEKEQLATVAGCCFIARRSVLEKLGGSFSPDFDQYDTHYHASFEDIDLAWRARLMGYQIGYVPDSIMYHKHRPRPMMPNRFGDYEWGRYLVVLRNYGLGSLLLLSPALIALDLAMWAYAISKGKEWVVAKRKVMKWLLTHPSEIKRMRQAVQDKRRVGDRDIVRLASPTLRIAHLTQGVPGVHKAFNLFFGLYYYAIFRPGVFLLDQMHKLMSPISRRVGKQWQ